MKTLRKFRTSMDIWEMLHKNSGSVTTFNSWTLGEKKTTTIFLSLSFLICKMGIKTAPYLKATRVTKRLGHLGISCHQQPPTKISRLIFSCFNSNDRLFLIFLTLPQHPCQKAKFSLFFQKLGQTLTPSEPQSGKNSFDWLFLLSRELKIHLHPWNRAQV